MELVMPVESLNDALSLQVPKNNTLKKNWSSPEHETDLLWENTNKIGGLGGLEINQH